MEIGIIYRFKIITFHDIWTMKNDVFRRKSIDAIKREETNETYFNLKIKRKKHNLRRIITIWVDETACSHHLVEIVTFHSSIDQLYLSIFFKLIFFEVTLLLFVTGDKIGIQREYTKTNEKWINNLICMYKPGWCKWQF